MTSGDPVLEVLSRVVPSGARVLHLECGDEGIVGELERLAGGAARVGRIGVRESVGWLDALGACGNADVVIAVSVHPLLDPEGQEALLRGIRRALGPGGLAVLRAVVANSPMDAAARLNPSLAAEGLQGAVGKADLIAAVARAGFGGIEIAGCPRSAWLIREGIEFRLMTAILHARAHDPEAGEGEFAVTEWTCGEDENDETALTGASGIVCRRGSLCC